MSGDTMLPPSSPAAAAAAGGSSYVLLSSGSELLAEDICPICRIQWSDETDTIIAELSVDHDMIACDMCMRWYHGCCIGINVELYEQQHPNEAFYCDHCRHQQQMQPNHQTITRFDLRAAFGAYQAKRPAPQKPLALKPARASTSSDSSDSDDEPLSRIARPKPKPTTPVAASPPTKTTAAASPPTLPKLQKLASTGNTPSPVPRKPSIIRPPPAAAAQKQQPSKQGNEMEIRRKVRHALTAILTPELGFAIDDALYKSCGQQVSSVYKQKFRDLIANLRDPNNPQLKQRIVSNALPVNQLVTLSAAELASSELLEQRKSARDESLKMAILDTSLAELQRLKEDNTRKHLADEEEAKKRLAAEESADVTAADLHVPKLESEPSGSDARRDSVNAQYSPSGRSLHSSVVDGAGNAQHGGVGAVGVDAGAEMKTLSDLQKSVYTDAVELPQLTTFNEEEQAADGRSPARRLAKRRPMDSVGAEHPETSPRNRHKPSPDAVDVSATPAVKPEGFVETYAQHRQPPPRNVWQGQIQIPKSSATAAALAAEGMQLPIDGIALGFNAVQLSGVCVTGLPLPQQVTEKNRVSLTDVEQYIKNLQTSSSKKVLIVELTALNLRDPEAAKYYTALNAYYRHRERAMVFDFNDLHDARFRGIFYIVPTDTKALSNNFLRAYCGIDRPTHNMYAVAVIPMEAYYHYYAPVDQLLPSLPPEQIGYMTQQQAYAKTFVQQQQSAKPEKPSDLAVKQESPPATANVSPSLDPRKAANAPPTPTAQSKEEEDVDLGSLTSLSSYLQGLIGSGALPGGDEAAAAAAAGTESPFSAQSSQQFDPQQQQTPAQHQQQPAYISPSPHPPAPYQPQQSVQPTPPPQSFANMPRPPFLPAHFPWPPPPGVHLPFMPPPPPQQQPQQFPPFQPNQPQFPFFPGAPQQPPFNPMAWQPPTSNMPVQMQPPPFHGSGQSFTAPTPGYASSNQFQPPPQPQQHSQPTSNYSSYAPSNRNSDHFSHEEMHAFKRANLCKFKFSSRGCKKDNCPYSHSEAVFQDVMNKLKR